MQYFSETTRLWFFIGLAAAVVVIVASAFYATREPGESLRDAAGISWVTVFGFLLWILCFLGLSRSGFTEPTLATWKRAMEIRIGFHLACWLVFSVSLFFDLHSADPDFARWAVVVAACLLIRTTLMCLNPIRDLAHGTVTRTGTLRFETTVTTHAYSSRRRYGSSTHRGMGLVLHPTDRPADTFELPDNDLARWTDDVENAPGRLWQVTTLPHVDWVIDVRHANRE